VKLKTSAGNADGSLLSDEEYSRQRIELLNEKASFEGLLHQEKRTEELLKLAIDAFEFAATVQEQFIQGDIDTKKAILFTVGSNLTLKDKKLSIEARKPFSFFDDSFPGGDSEIGPIEPENDGGLQRQKEANASSCPSLLRDVDEDRTLPRRYRTLIRAVYQFFEKRALCGCEECRDEFLNSQPIKRKRWNSGPTAESKCLFTSKNSLSDEQHFAA
jgi:hypothetical protein